jgi:hypothetical protein
MTDSRNDSRFRLDYRGSVAWAATIFAAVLLAFVVSWLNGKTPLADVAANGTMVVSDNFP